MPAEWSPIPDALLPQPSLRAPLTTEAGGAAWRSYAARHDATGDQSTSVLEVTT